MSFPSKRSYDTLFEDDADEAASDPQVRGCLKLVVCVYEVEGYGPA
jgi:hypothetical protein